MIDRVEAQRKLSPQSIPLLQTLAAYYRAANRLDRIKDVSEAMVRLRPDDLALRLQLATQLVQAGDVAGAIDHYRAVLKKSPALLGTYSIEISNAFRRAKKVDELVKLIDEVGFKSSPGFAVMASLVQALLNDPKTVDQGMALLRKIWDAFPTERMVILYYVSDNEAFWKRPESTTYVKEGIVAAPTSSRFLTTTWLGIDTITSRNLGGDRIDTPVTRLLDASTRDGTLDALAAEFWEAVASKRPRMALVGCKALLGLIRVRQGRIDEGKSILEAVLADPGVGTGYYEPLVIIAQELKDNPTTTPLARPSLLASRARRRSRRSGLMSQVLNGPWASCSSGNWPCSIARRRGRTAERPAGDRGQGGFDTFKTTLNAATPARAAVAHLQAKRTGLVRRPGPSEIGGPGRRAISGHTTPSPRRGDDIQLART